MKKINVLQLKTKLEILSFVYKRTAKELEKFQEDDVEEIKEILSEMGLIAEKERTDVSTLINDIFKD